MSTWAPAALKALIEEATVDAYGEDEQLTGFLTMIEESLAVPFTTTVLGVEVSVVGVDLAEARARIFGTTSAVGGASAA